MNPQPSDEQLPAVSSSAPAPASMHKRISRRASIMGAVIALLLLVGLSALAWYVTRPAPVRGMAAGSGLGTAGGLGAGRGGLASTVGVALAERASMPVVLQALGTVSPQAAVKVRPQVSGVLEKVLFSEGQMVKKGDLLAIIDPRQFEMALLQATGQRQRDEAQLDSARVTLQRYQTLQQQDSIARQEVDTQAALVKQLEGAVMIDKAAEGVARLNLGYTRVLAPVSGRVGLRAVDVGNVVGSSDTNGIVLITQVSPIDVVFAVPQDRVSDLQPAAAQTMQVLALDRSRAVTLETGVFASLDNQVDTSTGTVKAKARFANSKLSLFPSQFVNVELVLRTIHDAVVVPVTAVRQGSSGDYVYILNADRTVSLRPVTRGQATVDRVLISAGVQAGERVITEGADRLKDGARVILAAETPPRAVGGAGVGDRRQPASAPQAGGSASAAVQGPSPQQRQRLLDQVKDDPAALARRQKFLQQLDQQDPEALARWHSMTQRRAAGAAGEGSGP